MDIFLNTNERRILNKEVNSLSVENSNNENVKKFLIYTRIFFPDQRRISIGAY
jgi:hypothetical protein